MHESSGKNFRGYHRRSLAETGMYRFKVLFGRDLKCRTFQGQQSEAYVKARALNIKTSLGMPQSMKKQPNSPHLTFSQ